MKKVFSLIDPKKKIERVADQIRSEVKRYIKRERNKKLPDFHDYWDFDCRFGESEKRAKPVKLADISQEITNTVSRGENEFYLEILVKPLIRAGSLKTILITGSTDGIGLETAKQFLSLGHKVLIHGRNPEKIEIVAKDLTGDFETFCADLSKMSDIKRLVSELKNRNKEIDILINNAGILKTQNPKTDDGFDTRFMVNTLAPCYLSDKLIPILSKRSRIINLSSAAQASVSIQALKGEQQLDHFEAYAQSKLALTMWSQEFAKEVKTNKDKEASRPIVIAVNPGSLLKTKMVQEGFGTQGHDINIGVDILAHLALDKEHSANTGRYYDNDEGEFTKPHEDAQSERKVAQLISAINEILTSLD